ncbi:MAG: DUF4349 domain-containing protein [Cellvibrio sp.]|uniref:DUF4349 domain-containing protein n=1 Tax=Cellvibrio sp. TaxID=1965322 RepID=UPI0031AC01FF
MNKKFTAGLTYLLLILSLSGCESSDNKATEPSSNISTELAQRKTNPYLSYEHNLSVELKKDAISEKYKALIDHCNADRENNCTILESELSSNNYSRGEIKIRIKPAGVNTFLALAGNKGEITNESTTVEDLSTLIFDTEKRIKLLQSYQDNLLELQKQAKGDIESLIKVSQEIANTQSQLEDLIGNNKKLMQRVEMDIIKVRLHSRYEASFWTPITTALDEFKENLSEGIASAITAIAYLIPWSVVFVILFFMLRFFWRKLRGKSAKS